MTQKVKWQLFLRTRWSLLAALAISITLHSALFISLVRSQTSKRDFSVAYASQKRPPLPLLEQPAKRRQLNPLYVKKVKLHNPHKQDPQRKQPSSRFTASKVQRLNRSLQNRIVYPQLAVRRGWQGRVSITVTVSAAGQAKDVQVTHSSGVRLLDNTAIDAVQHWTFEKGKHDENLALHFAFRLQ